MSQLVNSRWFSLTDIVLVWTCGVVLFIWPQVGGWIIIITLLPWLIRLVAGNLPFERTGFEFPIIVFIVTAGVGVWAAYDRGAAWEKFWIVAGAIIIFIALAGQPKANLGVVAGLVGALGVIIAIYFLLSNDWNTQSSDFGVINRVGRWIMAVRPTTGFPPWHQNIVGGLLAILSPVTLALGYYQWEKGEYFKAFISGVMALVIFTGLLLTSSRGAWMAIGAGFGIWILWRASLFISKKISRPAYQIFLFLIFITAIPFFWFAMTYSGGVIALIDRVPGSPSGGSRYELAQSAVKLIGDFPITGGGLRSFPGLFSQYIMVTPYFLFAYSHNLFLDVILEQGWIGGFALLVVILGSLWLLVRQVNFNRKDAHVGLLSEAVLVSILVLLLHGFVDDAIYGDRGTPWIFLLPGLALMLWRYKQPLKSTTDQDVRTGEYTRNSRSLRNWLALGVSLFVIIGIGLFIFWKPVLAGWKANIGAVQMAQRELRNWPINEWNDNPDVSALKPAESLFTSALAYNIEQRTARHRLGLIAMQRREFKTAQDELEQANLIDSEHRGIRKSLGYTYVWAGNLDEAGSLLRGIREAEYEMGVYTWWWREQERQDLAWYAKEMSSMLQEHNRFNH
jgi:hypothetical protein